MRCVCTRAQEFNSTWYSQSDYCRATDRREVTEVEVLTSVAKKHSRITDVK
jgi:hypothetical protein